MLPLSKYEIFFEADESVSIPNPPGLLWHSVFGKALHDVCCTHPNLDCEKCLRLHDCDYPALFKPALPPGAQIMTKYSQIPPPHLFQSRLSESPSHQKQAREFSIDVTLIGKANSRLAAALHAMQMLGKNGIGKKRIPARVTKIRRHRQGLPPQWLHESDVGFDEPEVIHIPKLPRNICITFVSPYSPPGNRSSAPDKFDLSAFLMAVVRRIDLLSYFYGEKKLDEDFKALKELSNRNIGVSRNLKSSVFGHYSTRQNGVLKNNGITGGLLLSREIWGDFWPFLYTGQFVNCGKKSSYGLGQFTATIPD